MLRQLTHTAERYKPFKDNIVKINKVISNFIEYNLHLQKSLHDNSSNKKPDVNSVTKFISLTEASRYNYQLGLELTLLLQSVDDKNIYEQYNLENISDLFTSLIELKRSDLDNYIEASHFEWAVMDNKEKALKIIETGIKTAESKIKKLKEIQKEINN